MENETPKRRCRLATPEEMRENALKTPVRTPEQMLEQMKRLREFRLQEEAKRAAAEAQATKHS